MQEIRFDIVDYLCYNLKLVNEKFQDRLFDCFLRIFLGNGDVFPEKSLR